MLLELHFFAHLCYILQAFSICFRYIKWIELHFGYIPRPPGLKGCEKKNTKWGRKGKKVQTLQTPVAMQSLDFILSAVCKGIDWRNSPNTLDHLETVCRVKLHVGINILPGLHRQPSVNSQHSTAPGAALYT